MGQRSTVRTRWGLQKRWRNCGGVSIDVSSSTATSLPDDIGLISSEIGAVVAHKFKKKYAKSK